MVSKTAKELGYSEQEVVEVLQSIVDHLDLLVAKKEFKGIMLPHLGKFYVRPTTVFRILNPEGYKQYREDHSVEFYRKYTNDEHKTKIIYEVIDNG